jgi:hypothetical protein
VNDIARLQIAVVLAGRVRLNEVSVEVGEGVGFFLVNGVITDHALLVGHAKRNAKYKLDKGHDGRSPENVPADDEEGSHNLDPHLTTVSSNGTTVGSSSESVGTSGDGENTRKETSNKGSDKVGMENVKGVVNMLEGGDVTLSKIESDLIYVRLCLCIKLENLPMEWIQRRYQ